jgi:transcriptional regulator with XRE-family HTH domain
VNRFLELRQAKHLTQAELIQQFNERYGRTYSIPALSLFENGRRLPEIPALIDFADFFGCSIDHLIGRDKGPQYTTGNRLRDLRKAKGLSQNELGKMLGVNQSVVTGWETDYRKPVRKLKELTALFGVSADYLMGFDEPEEPEQIELPTEPAPPTRDDVIQAFANLFDVASAYLVEKAKEAKK